MVYEDMRTPQPPLESVESLTVVMEKAGGPPPFFSTENGSVLSRLARRVAQVLFQRLIPSVFGPVGDQSIIVRKRSCIDLSHDESLPGRCNAGSIN